MSLSARLQDLIRYGPLGVLIDGARLWIDSRASSKGAALALYMIFSLAPILLLVVATAGWLFGEAAVRDQLLLQIEMLAGERSAEAVATVMQNAHYSSGGLVAAIVSAALLIFSSTTAFAELKASLEEMWGVDARSRSGLHATALTRLVSFGIVLLLSAVLLLSVFLDAVLGALQSHWSLFFSEEHTAIIARLISHAVSFAIVVVLFAIVLKTLPGVPMRWRDVLPGAMLTALLFLVGKIGIGLYLGSGTVVSSYGAAGSVIALILWIYFSALIFFYGAACTHAYWRRYGSGRRSGPAR